MSAVIIYGDYLEISITSETFFNNLLSLKLCVKPIFSLLLLFCLSLFVLLSLFKVKSPFALLIFNRNILS